jgi:glycosyltransferase involved in cell wall biosynthesis
LWWGLDWPSIDFYLPETDLFHSLHIQIPPTKNIKTVLTVHDCRYLAFPELYKDRDVETYRRQMQKTLSRVDMVATVSEFTRQEVINHFSFPEDRIRVIHNGFHSLWQDDCDGTKVDQYIKKNNLPKYYLLYTGVLDPRKNLERLIEAMAQCRQEADDFPDLVVAGIRNVEWNKSKHAHQAKKRSVSDHIHVCGVVAKEVLIGLMQRAHALCYPSLYEGFGFPPLEAMSVGVPVLAGKSSAIPEIAGNAACLVDPTSVDGIAQGLNRIVFDQGYRRMLVERGYQQIKKFSWRKAATEYINLYQFVMNL